MDETLTVVPFTKLMDSSTQTAKTSKTTMSKRGVLDSAAFSPREVVVKNGHHHN